MPVFPLLADGSTYDPHEIRPNDPDSFNHWLTLFTQQIENVCENAVESEGHTDDAKQRAAAARDAFLAWLAPLHDDPQAHGELTLLGIDAKRDGILEEHGFADAFSVVKQKENDLALPLLAGVLKELDALPDDQRLLQLVRGIFAGNIFDLGIQATVEMFKNNGVDFHRTRASLPDRPWCVDSFDALAERWAVGPHRKAMVFVDNAGADVTLGMVPLCREMLRRSTQVVIAANTGPSLNDITHAELIDHIQHIAQFDQTIAHALDTDQLKLIPSGCELPLIDLSKVSDDVVAESDGVDFVVLEGMGRALETNFNAEFTCDALKIAMVKDEQVATWLGGKVYDVICRFDAASE